LHFRFQKTPFDLFAALSYTLVSSIVLVATNRGNPVALLTVIFFPGYLLSAAIFPSNGELDWAERLAISLGLDIAVIASLGVTLSSTGLGVNLSSSLGSIVTFTVLAFTFAYWRRIRLPVGNRLAFNISIGSHQGHEGILDNALTVILVASLVIAIVGFTQTILKPQADEHFSEFSMSAPGTNASNYPSHLNVSEAGTVILIVANHEGASIGYTVRIDLIGIRVVDNASIEVNRTTWAWLNVTLVSDGNWTYPYTFRISYVGHWKVQFLLYIDNDLTSAYRQLNLYLAVS
jgi:uncharacterized membrane protein